MGQPGARIEVPILVLKLLTLQLSLGIFSPKPCLLIKFIELASIISTSLTTFLQGDESQDKRNIVLRPGCPPDCLRHAGRFSAINLRQSTMKY